MPFLGTIRTAREGFSKLRSLKGKTERDLIFVAQELIVKPPIKKVVRHRPRSSETTQASGENFFGANFFLKNGENFQPLIAVLFLFLKTQTNTKSIKGGLQFIIYDL